MSQLIVYADHNAALIHHQSEEHDVICHLLADIGVLFERWTAVSEVTVDMSSEQIMAAYQRQIDSLKTKQGYVTVDTISLTADNPMKDELRQKFLSEHTHSEDEVRFFVRGEGMFYLHKADRVYQVHCCKGDLISVPANVAHWFDMGPAPDFCAIRLFNNPEGWVAAYTGSDIATLFPKFEGL
ncbi:MAG: 1,2-dihydroxy-3-keto-5-methylthiopentene dioxygenase [Pontibacterium sp.]